MGESLTERHRRMVLPTLIVAVSSIDPPALIVSICLIEVALAFVVSLLIVCFMNMPSYMLTLAVIPALSFFGGVILTSVDTLTLEQAPTARGTMMSMNSVAMKLGNALGAGVGGLMLLLFNWNVVGFSLGFVGIVSAGIYQVLTEEPGGVSE